MVFVCDAMPIMLSSVVWESRREEGTEPSLMTKADLVEEVARVVEVTRKDAEVIVETIFNSIVKSLRGGDKIEIRGYGSFRTRQRRGRTGRNPQSGEQVQVPPKTIPFFKPGKELRDVVNGGPPPPATPLVR